MLATLGYSCTTVVDGMQAVDYFRDHGSEVDLVLLDMTMPTMGGLDCYRALQDIDPAVRVILSTGHAGEGLSQELIDQGIVDLIRKPYLTDQLAEVLDAALRKSPDSS
jgi:CheY-like chemotaxis protein